jgi:hypothetical protein
VETFKSPSLVFSAVLLLVTLTLGCFGYEREWSTNPASILVSNRGRDRYIYKATLTGAPRSPASRPALPVLDLIPGDMREIAVINVRSEFNGPGGLVRSEGELYQDLSEVGQRLGATHFHVSKTGFADSYITSLAASALVPAAAPVPEASPPTQTHAPVPEHKCVASSLPEWAGASPEQKRELLRKCR